MTDETPEPESTMSDFTEAELVELEQRAKRVKGSGVQSTPVAPDLFCRLIAAIRQRDKTIAELPKTADGVSIVPGMVVWAVRRPHGSRPWIGWLLADQVGVKGVWCNNESRKPAGEQGAGYADCSARYSTREAALAASASPPADAYLARLKQSDQDHESAMAELLAMKEDLADRASPPAVEREPDTPPQK